MDIEQKDKKEEQPVLPQPTQPVEKIPLITKEEFDEFYRLRQNYKNSLKYLWQ